MAKEEISLSIKFGFGMLVLEELVERLFLEVFDIVEVFDKLITDVVVA